MEVGIGIFLCKIEIQGQFIFEIFWFKYFFLLKTAFLIFEIARLQKMKKYNPHSNRTRSRLVPAPKTLIVAAGTIRAGTVFILCCSHTRIQAILKKYKFTRFCIDFPVKNVGLVGPVESILNGSKGINQSYIMPLHGEKG